MERNIIFYRVFLYIDDGTNIDYVKPRGLSDTDVFSDYEEAWSWCQDKEFADNAVIQEETDDILNINEYRFVDMADEPSEMLYKLKTIGTILHDIEFRIVDKKERFGTMTKNGFFFNDRFYSWKNLQTDKKLMEKILDGAEYDIRPKSSYSLNREQKNIVDEIYSLVEQASSMDIGFYYDIAENKMFAFNAENVALVQPTIKKCNARLTNDVAEGCETTFHGHYDSKKQSLGIVEDNK